MIDNAPPRADAGEDGNELAHLDEILRDADDAAAGGDRGAMGASDETKDGPASSKEQPRRPNSSRWDNGPTINVYGARTAPAIPSILSVMSAHPSIFVTPEPHRLIEVRDGRIERVDRHALVRMSGCLYCLVKITRTEKGEKREPIDLPASTASALLASPLREYNFRPLSLLTNRPVLLRDGGVISACGYSTIEGEGVMLQDAPVDWRSLIPETPTRDDAKKAMDYLATFVDEFCFVKRARPQRRARRRPDRRVMVVGAVDEALPFLRSDRHPEGHRQIPACRYCHIGGPAVLQGEGPSYYARLQ